MLVLWLLMLLVGLVPALLVLWLLLSLVSALLVIVLLMLMGVLLLIPVTLMVPMIPLRELLRHLRRAALQIDIHPPCVRLGGVLEPEFPTYLFHAGFDFLDVVGGVVAFADDAIER